LFFFCFGNNIGKEYFQAYIYVYLMINVYSEPVICNCHSAKILRTQHFVTVYELTSIHDDILSNFV